MIKKIMSSELMKGSLVLFILFNSYNFLNFLFQFLMARMLEPKDYGMVAALIAFLYFIIIPTDTIQLVISKYTSKFALKKEYGKIKYLINKTITKGLFISLILFLIIIIISPFLGALLKLPFYFVILAGLIMFIVFPLAAVRGGLQGMKKFKSLGINMNAEAIIKVVIALILISIGWNVYGALIGILIGSFIALFFVFFSIKEINKSKKEKIKINKLYLNSSQIIYVLMAVMAFQSIDIILSRIFFSEITAGYYAIANLTGKMIFFGTIAISKVMFPISSERTENGNKTNGLLWKSLIMASFLCCIALIIFWIFPELFIKILFGEDKLIVAPIIFNIGIGFGFIALTNIVLLYAVSINKKIKLIEVLILLAIQILLLYFLSEDIYTYSIAMAFSGLFMFIGSLLILTKKKIYK